MGKPESTGFSKIILACIETILLQDVLTVGGIYRYGFYLSGKFVPNG